MWRTKNFKGVAQVTLRVHRYDSEVVSSPQLWTHQHLSPSCLTPFSFSLLKSDPSRSTMYWLQVHQKYKSDSLLYILQNVNKNNISKQIQSTAFEPMQRQTKPWQLESLDDQVHGEVGSGSKPDRQRKYSLPKLPRGHLGKAQAARETIRGQFSFIPTISITSLTRSHARGIGVTRSRRI